MSYIIVASGENDDRFFTSNNRRYEKYSYFKHEAKLYDTFEEAEYVRKKLIKEWDSCGDFIPPIKLVFWIDDMNSPRMDGMIDELNDI